MAKIYCNNSQYNGISAGVSFVNGVGVTSNSHLIAWFTENGYTIIEDTPREPGEYDEMNYKDLIELAKQQGFNAIGYKKEQLIQALIELDVQNYSEMEG
jgi:hypothetical protein